jgi:hypothetical protein
VHRTAKSYSFQLENPRLSLPTGPWCQDDAKWFRRHKGRAYRARQAYPGETNGHPYDPVTDRIVVRKVTRHFRMRFSVHVAECAPDSIELMAGLIERAEHSEAASHLLFDLVAKPEHNGRLIPRAELSAMIQLYEAGNGAMN